MIELSNLRMAWDLLNAKERRSAMKVLFVIVMAALASAAMVGSVFPFLSLLADPSLVDRSEFLSSMYSAGGFTSDFEFLVAVGIGTALIIFLMNVILFAHLWVITRFTEMQSYSLSHRLLSHYLAQPYEYFLNTHSGEMTTNILGEAGQVVAGFMRPFAGLISAIFTIAAIFATLLIVNPLVTIVAVASFAVIYVLIVAVTRRGVHTMGQRRALANAQRFRLANEALSGVKDIKLLGREATYVDRFSVPAREMAGYQVNVRLISNTPQFALQVVAFCGIVLLSLVLLDPTSLRNRDALGELLPLLGVLAFAGQRLLPQLHAVYGAITEMTYGKAALQRVHADLFKGQNVDLDRSEPAPLGLKSTMTLEAVTYSYPQAKAPGVNSVNLTVNAGERIGIVGSSGAGKTTLADVVLGLLTPQSGHLFVDGVKVTPNNKRAWQKSVGYVPQDIFLTDASLSENIALGLHPSEIDAAKVEECARIARLHDFIVSELPEGYETMVGERGVRLSGGQRQRIGIARALYHDADLIVFDEATSALDNLTESEVMASIQALPGDKTILMIAHRLSTVEVCDRVIVMERGSITGVGSLDQLRQSNPAFRRMAEAS